MNPRSLTELNEAYYALPVTTDPLSFLAGEGNWGLTESEYHVAKELAVKIVALGRKTKSAK